MVVSSLPSHVLLCSSSSLLEQCFVLLCLRSMLDRHVLFSPCCFSVFKCRGSYASRVLGDVSRSARKKKKKYGNMSKTCG